MPALIIPKPNAKQEMFLLADKKYVAFGGGYKGDTETVNVTGGTFTAGIGRYDASDVWQDIAY